MKDIIRLIFLVTILIMALLLFSKVMATSKYTVGYNQGFTDGQMVGWLDGHAIGKYDGMVQMYQLALEVSCRNNTTQPNWSSSTPYYYNWRNDNWDYTDQRDIFIPVGGQPIQ